ncbi:conserved hypothetical protein, secreted [Candidatus Thiomargarita nelsonii]|uniref:Uncharacterized protein n=1 Tax=Candidatus Thiomargarita nelsonii TaxID=1003181 RepID=A0A176RY95_9GAMM|nr:conserved hypothetical protein, secreted [Candidatus Thiomargarita nelsonii]
MSKYTLFIISLAIALLAYWAWNYDPRVSELNDLLSQDSELSNYPYQFKVIELDEGTAVMSSPRSAQVSVLKFLSIIKPELHRKNSDSPEVIAAQKELAHHQQKAKKMVLSQPDVKQIRWELDKGWFAGYGIYVDDY